MTGMTWTGTGMTGLLMRDGRELEQEREQARWRAAAAAQALLHQPGAATADEAWQVVSALDRLAAELRAAYAQAEDTQTQVHDEAQQSARRCQAWQAWQAWQAPAAALVARLEEATAWWVSRSSFPWSNWADWDSSATEELGMLL
ncbi:MAG TPA: hypothetical protein VH372_18010, partial [Actinospica sp.]|nr:hypothetical protein [Actinospica sp.]